MNEPEVLGGNGQPQPIQHPAIPRCGCRGKSRVYIFVPQEDITPRELAASMEMLLFGLAAVIKIAPVEFSDLLYESMEDGVKRHWVANEITQGPQIAVAQKPKGLHLPPGAMSHERRR